MRFRATGGGAAPRAAVVGAALLFSTGGAAIKASSLGGFHVAAARSAVAALALAMLFPAARRGWSLRTLAVALAFAATLVLFVLGNKLTTGANSIFLQSAAPLYLLMLGPWLLGERIARRDLGVMAALGFGLALFYLDAPPVSATAPDPALGNLLATASGVTWALTLAGLRWLERREPDGRGGLRSVVAGNLVAAALAGGPALASGPVTVRGLDLALVAYLGVFQIGLAYALLTRGLREVGAFEGSLLILVEPAASPLWTWWLHGERPGGLALAGGGVILAASTVKGWLDRRGAADV